MDSSLLKKIFGPSPSWQGACIVLVDSNTSVKTMGQDSIVAGGIKSFAPRITSGRVTADAVCYHPDLNALLVVQRNRVKTSTGEDVDQQILLIVDIGHVIGVEFEALNVLERLGIPAPPKPEKPRYAAGALVG
jgi:hypothetical protein